MSSFASMLMGEVNKAKDKAEKSIREELEKVKAKAESYLTGKKVEPKKVKKEDSRERTRQLITDDVYLYSTKIYDPLSFSFEIGSTCPKTLKITLNFQGSENFRALDENNNYTDLELTMVVAPFHRKILGSMVQMDPGSPGRLEMDYSWELVEIDHNKVKVSVDQILARVNNQLQKQLSLQEMDQVDEGDESEFIDTAFPPCTESLYAVNKAAGNGDQEGQEPVNEVIVWHRPDDFMGGKFDVFIGGIEPGDICQGSLGDCWFLCTLACLGEFPEMVESLFMNDSRSASACGRYNIRLCHYGAWETITVDDFFPCYPDGGPVYARGHDNELWVLLLEKAYAKLCGSYAALKSGWAYEAMLDLTGAPYATIRFDDENTIRMIEDGSLWALMKNNDDYGYIQTASTPGEDKLTVGGERRAKDHSTGLVAGHAYALLRAATTSTGVDLVEMRNPWGQGGMEWNGDWSDKSPLWTEKIKAEIDAELKDNDGAFWMSLTDFLDNFYSINVCNVRPPGKPHWHESRERFSYSMIDGTEGELVSAPSYVLTLQERSDYMYVSVHQKDIRCVGISPYVDVGVTVLSLHPDGSWSLVASTGNSADRQNQTETLCLEAGQYLVLPTSTGCKLRHVAGHTVAATVVIHTSSPHTLNTHPFNPEAFEDAIELPIMKYGVTRVLDPHKVTLYTRKSGFSGVSYVVKNDHIRTLKFTQDCSVGKNIVSHRGTLAFEETIPPGEAKVLHHIMPENSSLGWQSGFSAKYDWV